MKHQVQAVLFDMDGVLIDTAVLLIATYNEISKQLDTQRPAEAQILQTMSMPPRKAVAYLFGSRASDADNLFDVIWRANVHHVQPFKGIPDVLTHLRNKRLSLGIVTSRNRLDTLSLLNAADLVRYVDDIVTWGHYRVAKPSPTCLFVALERIGVGAINAAYVGDQTRDMQAAKQAGCMAIGVTWSHTLEKDLISGGADAVIREPREIINVVL